MASSASPDSSPPARERHPQPGDVLDRRYRLAERLGHGGFGDVFRAEELLPDGGSFREVALKLLHVGGDDVVSWTEEAKLLASFRHPSLVTIYAAGILETTPPRRFVAMELLDGQNLAEVQRARGPIPWRPVLRWAYSAAAALDLIHLAGVVHLDLKPQNLFLCADGALKVLDFGIARRAGAETFVGRRVQAFHPQAGDTDPMAATGLYVFQAGTTPEEAFAATRPMGSSAVAPMVIGTPGFMAPEVLELAEPTAAADAFALAVCVVQLATGHLPYAAPDEPPTWDDPTAVSAWLDELRRATLRGALRDFDAGGAPFPRGLSALVRRLLAVDPAARGVISGQLGALFQEAWDRPHGVPSVPYFGLSPFPPEGEGLLFGRDDDVARLGRELEYEPAVVLQGGPGVGKTSLAVAGLVPYLARRGIDGKDEWTSVPIAPGDRPDEALGRALAAVDPALAEAGLDELAAHCEAAKVGLVLCVDPLEAALRPAGAERLAALLEGIATGPSRPGLRLIGALGEDHTAELLAAPLGVPLRAALRFVGAPSTAAVKDLVAAPAHFAGVQILGADVVASDVQRELRADPARLPFVALALRAFWEDRERDPRGDQDPRSHPVSSAAGALRGARWRESGGVRGAIVRHADRVFHALEPDERALAEEILLRLSATDGTSVSWARAELDEVLGGPPSAAEGALAALIREHLVRDQAGTIAIGHEALLTAWPWLSSARLAHMDRLVFLERLRNARLAWERADEHRDFLLHGELLDEVRAHGAWISRGVAAPDRRFAAASLRRARLRRVSRAGLGLLLAAGVAGGLFLQGRAEEAREAERRARAEAAAIEEVSELAARARRTEDPYFRAAYLATAMERGLPDGLLPLELAASTANLARADFLTLDQVVGPSFPWDDRWLLGSSSSSTLTLVDFLPREPDVIEDVDLDFDPNLGDQGTHVKRPKVLELTPHDAPLAERVPFAFDTAFATRSTTGEVKVFRLREDGVPVLAAIAPMRCAGALRAAAAAPVLACATDQGLARWDMRAFRKDPALGLAVDKFLGNVADVSADGERLVAVTGKRVLMWAPNESRRTLHTASWPVLVARESPRDRVVALVDAKAIEIVSELAHGPALLKRSHFAGELESVRWDEGGLDLAVCGAAGGAFYHLRSGGRPKGEAAPAGDPCAAPRPKNQPTPLRGPRDFAEVADREVGPHLPSGGFRLRRHRLLTRDLVVLDAAPSPGAAAVAPAAAPLLRFQAHDEIGGDELPGERDSVVAVERDERSVLFQVGDEIRVYTLPDGNRLLARKGNFLRRCADGRPLAWLAKGDHYRVFDAWTGADVAAVPRQPGFVVGADSACRALYTQGLDGALVEHTFAGGPEHRLPAADGYVIDARPSPARGPLGPGLWLSFSSGAVARLDEAAGHLALLGYATPYASAIADGPRPGEVAIADATGVTVLKSGAAPRRLLESSGDTTWEDLSVAPDGASMLLASADRVAALDLGRHELLGSIPNDGRERFARWDDDGSVLLWSHGRFGGAEGMVIPRGVPLAKAVAGAVSNLVVDRKGRLAIKR